MYIVHTHVLVCLHDSFIFHVYESTCIFYSWMVTSVETCAHRIPVELSHVRFGQRKSAMQDCAREAGQHLLQLAAHFTDDHVFRKDETERKNFEKGRGIDLEVRPAHHAGSFCHQHRTVVEFKIHDVVVLSVLRLIFGKDADLYFFSVDLPDHLHLANDVAQKSLPLRDVVQVKTLGCLARTEERRRAHIRVAETQVFMQIDQPVQKIPQVTPQHSEKTGITVATDVLRKILTKHGHNLISVFSQLFRSSIDEAGYDTLRVHLQR